MVDVQLRYLQSRRRELSVKVATNSNVANKWDSQALSQGKSAGRQDQITYPNAVSVDELPVHKEGRAVE
jgi:hypothetical protein